MIPLQVVAIVLVGVSATIVVFTRDVLRMTIANSVFGFMLTILFLIYQAPDVALSMVVVGAIAYPVVLLSAIAKVRARDDDEDEPG